MTDPINRIEWRPANELRANHYNPNVVMNQELSLLEFSILRSGWIQPILVTKDGTIIDGFHRWSLSVQSKALREKYLGRVPCVVMDLSPSEAMLLTVRINRAKGAHVAVRMHELVRLLIDEHGLDAQQVAQGIGAYKNEVELLYADGVFKARNIQNHEYSRAWAPRTKNERESA